MLVLIPWIYSPLHAEIISYRVPGIETSKDFQVWANGQEVFTGQAGGGWHGLYSFSQFDFTGEVLVRVKAKRAIKWLDILPSARKIKTFMIDDHSFEFTLENPENISVLLNNDKNNALHILSKS